MNEYEHEAQLGCQVRDTATGFIGTIVARHEEGGERNRHWSATLAGKNPLETYRIPFGRLEPLDGPSGKAPATIKEEGFAEGFKEARSEAVKLIQGSGLASEETHALIERIKAMPIEAPFPF